jgi:CHAD domain-containing protein
MKPPGISAFARAQAQLRLKRLLAQVRRGSKHPEDPAAIHDLRVSIRRFTQCLRTFRTLFDARPLRKIKRRLRKLMDACAAVRSCDVACSVLEQAGVTKGPAAEHLSAARTEDEQALRDLLSKQHKRKTSNWEERLRVDVHIDSEWDPGQSLPGNVARILPALAQDFFEEGASAAAAGADHETLHRFRLHAKRFRYALELFPSLYGSEMKRGLAALRGLQDRLGAINDCVATIALIHKDRRAVAAVRKLLRQREQEFQAYWQRHFPAGKLAWWQGWLSRPHSVTP